VTPANPPGPAWTSPTTGGSPEAAQPRLHGVSPLQVLLQRDDEGDDRQSAPDLLDAFDSKEKTLHANICGHTGVPQAELDAGARFFARHLK
jgi:hypothetical protein